MMTEQRLIFPEQQSLNRYYSGLASELAAEPGRVHAVPWRQSEFRACVANAATYAEARTVMELACGIGFWTEILAARAKEVYATDVLPACVTIARQRVSSPTVRFAAMDATRMSIRSAGIDTVFSGFWLSHLPRTAFPSICNKLNRGLKSGTKVMFIESEYPSRHLRPFVTVTVDGDTFDTRSLRDGSTHLVLKNYWTDDDLTGALKKDVRELAINRSTFYYSVTYIIA